MVTGPYLQYVAPPDPADREDHCRTYGWHFPHYREPDILPYSIIRSGDWKLIKRYEGWTFELYNLADDLSEANDLSEEMPEKVEELDAELTAWLDETGAKRPKENPEFK